MPERFVAEILGIGFVDVVEQMRWGVTNHIVASFEGQREMRAIIRIQLTQKTFL